MRALESGTMKTPTKYDADAQGRITALERSLDEAFKLLEKIHAELKPRAVGTGDVTAAAAEAVASERPVPPPVLSLDDRIVRALKVGIFTLEELAREVHASAGPVGEVLKRLRAENRIINLGNDARPRWAWLVGDETSFEELKRTIVKFIADRPMYLQDLLHATGARRNRVSGVLSKMHRDGEPVLNLGTPARGRWFMILGPG